MAYCSAFAAAARPGGDADAADLGYFVGNPVCNGGGKVGPIHGEKLGLGLGASLRDRDGGSGQSQFVVGWRRNVTILWTGEAWTGVRHDFLNAACAST